MVRVRYLTHLLQKTNTMSKIINTGVQLGGDVLNKGGVDLIAFLFDSSGDILFSSGATVPVDGNTGLAIGSLFIDTTGGTNVTLYVNEATAENSCSFKAALDT